jgi:hypothetical protein
MKTSKTEIAAIIAGADLAGLRKLDPSAQLRALRGQKVEREFIVQRDTVDKEKRTVWMSIASDDPYERWWGVEILDCKKGSIRERRMTTRSRLTGSFGSSRGSAVPRVPRKSGRTCSTVSGAIRPWAMSSTTSCSKKPRRASTRTASPTGSRSKARLSPSRPIRPWA